MPSCFSDSFADYTRERLAARKELLAPLAEEIERTCAELADDEALLVRHWYATLPVNDVFDTAGEIFASFARHALMLRREVERCAALPEDVFVHFVACPRVNNEALTDCRPVFWNELAERCQNLSVRDAVLEANYWCAEKATYQASDGRTLGPLGVLASGDGRCGEESTFLVTALRSIGIAARQIYTPWWAHCDDNHAWVEAYVDGGWHYLGACEPDEALDRGWFTAASGRALLEHTRLFCDFGCDFERDRALLAREGSMVVVNVTASYAPVTLLTVHVADASGAPAAGADVELMLVNMAGWRDLARLVTDENGDAVIEIGLGTMRVAASTGAQTAEAVVNTEDTDRVELVLADGAGELAGAGTFAAGHNLADGAWHDLDIAAPADHPAPSERLTDEQQERGRARKREVDEMRRARIDGLRAAAAQAAGRVCAFLRENGELAGEDAARIERFFALSFANAPEVERFLTADAGHDRVELLGTLTDKDFRDLIADVLEEHLQVARTQRADAMARLVALGATEAEADELFVSSVLSPRAFFETLTPWRRALPELFSDSEKAAFAEDPHEIWAYINRTVRFDVDENAGRTAASPVGALRSHQGSAMTKRVLFVAICRSLGIAARMNHATLAPEFYARGGFVAVEAAPKEHTVPVTVTCPTQDALTYEQDWSIARLTPAAGLGASGTYMTYQTLDYYGRTFENDRFEVELAPGIYRATTSARLPNGNQQISERLFCVAADAESCALELRVREPEASDMLSNIALEDFAVRDAEGGHCTVTAAAVDGMALLAYLEPSEEPTEHLLNELRERADQIADEKLAVLLVVPDLAMASDPTLARTLEALPQVILAEDDFSERPERLARRMFANPEKLPLAVLADGRGETLHGLYATAGYNVGTVDLVLKLARLAREA